MSESTKIIPNKLSKLTYYLFDNYNDQLECETCRHCWSKDGTAFSKDQAGTKDGMYYRYFRCKGKGKGKCSALYSHEDFLALATRQLGSFRMEQIRKRFDPLNSNQSKPKREHDSTSTGFTPDHKRQSIYSPLVRNALPPKFSSYSAISTDNRGVSQGSLSTEPSSSQLDVLQDKVRFLEKQLHDKDSYITDLKEYIELLKESKRAATPVPHQVFVEATPSPIPSVSPLPCSDVEEIIPTSPIQANIPSSYAEIARSTPTSSNSRPAAKSPSTDRREVLQEKYKLSVIYFLGLNCKKVGIFRKDMKNAGLSLEPIHNIIFIGTSITEVLIESKTVQSFVDQATSLGFSIDNRLDMTKKDKSNPVWLMYGNNNSSLSDVIKSNFVRRISHEIKSCQEPRVKQYYHQWADSLGWTDSLLLASTSSISP